MKEIPSNKEKEYTISEFCGIDKRTRYSDSGGSFEIVNFEIEHDGSLTKRCGYRSLIRLPERITAIWTGNIGGKFCGYALAGSEVYALDLEAESYVKMGDLGTQSDAASFFCYRGAVYLINGIGLYRVSDGSLTHPHGYVPLIGKDWSDAVIGEINEPRNLLNNKGRITYVISENATSFLKTDEPIASIDALYVNGVKRTADTYEISAMPRTVMVSNLAAGDRVELHYTYAEALEGIDGLLSNTASIVFGGINNTRPFLWGGLNAAVMYSSAYVSDHSLAASLKAYPESDALYFPSGYEFLVGDGRCPITAVSRHYDRLLIFTKEGAWAANSSACGIEDFPTMSVNSSYGVSSSGGAAMLENQPCTISAHSIMRWTADTEELDECNAYSISDPIADLLDDSFFEDARVYADKARSRLFFCSPSLDKTLLLYYSQKRAWVRFTGIDADMLFDAGDDVGFIKGGELFVFDGACVRDLDKLEIVGGFEGNIADFGTSKKKRLTTATVAASGGVINLRIVLDTGVTKTIKLADATVGYVRAQRRITMGRFKSAHFMLVAPGSARQSVHSLCIKAI